MGKDVRVGITGSYECCEAAQRERQTGILGSPCGSHFLIVKILVVTHACHSDY